MQYQSEQLDQIAEALAKAQDEMDFARKDSSNPFFKSSYADLASVWDVCRQVLPKNGLAVSQSLVPGEGINVRTLLMHKSGQWVCGVCQLPPVKNDPQAYGSAITYARRYSLAAIVGVIADDDDGECAMGRRGGEKKEEPVKPAKTQTTKKPAAKADDDLKGLRELVAKAMTHCELSKDSVAAHVEKMLGERKSSMDMTRQELEMLLGEIEAGKVKSLSANEEMGELPFK